MGGWASWLLMGHHAAVLNVRTSWLATPLALMACSADTTPPPNAGDATTMTRRDAQPSTDSGADPIRDADPRDANPPDASATDAGFLDALFADAEPGPDASSPPCTYPSGAPARPTEDQTLARYQWNRAVDLSGMAYALDMQEVHCATDTDIDWTAFPHVLFMAVPAW
jgi:hypothetical protein